MKIKYSDCCDAFFDIDGLGLCPECGEPCGYWEEEE